MVTLPPKVANNPNLEVTKQPNLNLNRKQGDGKQPGRRAHSLSGNHQLAGAETVISRQ